jgi:hypothetical protein
MKCTSPSGRHWWKDGWICERCGIRKADMKKIDLAKVYNCNDPKLHMFVCKKGFEPEELPLNLKDHCNLKWDEYPIIKIIKEYYIKGGKS